MNKLIMKKVFEVGAYVLCCFFFSVLGIHDGACGGLESSEGASSDGFAIVAVPPDMKNAEPEDSEAAKKKVRAKTRIFVCFLYYHFLGW